MKNLHSSKQRKATSVYWHNSVQNQPFLQPPYPSNLTQTVTISQIRKWSFSFSYTLHSVLCMPCCKFARWDRFCTCRHSAVLSRHLDRSCQARPLTK